MNNSWVKNVSEHLLVPKKENTRVAVSHLKVPLGSVAKV